MADMKRTPAERAEERAEELDEQENGPEYPWGLTIRLEQEELDKLDNLTDKKAGDVCIINAKAIITRVSSEDELDGEGKENSINLQITDMEVTPENTTDNAEKLYGDKEE